MFINTSGCPFAPLARSFEAVRSASQSETETGQRVLCNVWPYGPAQSSAAGNYPDGYTYLLVTTTRLLRAAQAAGAPGLPSRRRCTVWRHNDLFRAHVPTSARRSGGRCPWTTLATALHGVATQ